MNNENLKVTVNDKVESKKVQELLFKLGYGWPMNGKNVIVPFIAKYPYFLYARCKGKQVTWGSTDQVGTDTYALITIPELEERVILQRNDVKDATHIDQDKWKWLLISGNSYVWGAGNSEQQLRWDAASLNHVDLTPITPPETEIPQAEFLKIQRDEVGKILSVTLQVLDATLEHPDYVRVPEGGNYAYDTYNGGFLFFKDDSNWCTQWFNKEWYQGTHDRKGYEECHKRTLIWQRETPEQKPAPLVLVEYLDPLDWALKTIPEYKKVPSDWIKVPEGAVYAVSFRDKVANPDPVYFYDADLNLYDFDAQVWSPSGYSSIDGLRTSASGLKRADIVWQRHPYPTPEAPLPDAAQMYVEPEPETSPKGEVMKFEQLSTTAKARACDNYLEAIKRDAKVYAANKAIKRELKEYGQKIDYLMYSERLQSICYAVVDEANDTTSKFSESVHGTSRLAQIWREAVKAADKEPRVQNTSSDIIQFIEQVAPHLFFTYEGEIEHV